MNMMQKLTHLMLLFMCVAMARPALASDIVYLYSYHNHPPFVTAEHAGLTQRLAQYLSAQSDGQIRVEVRVLPRARLNKLLADWIAGDCPDKACADNWMLAWVNPSWGFIGGDEDPYHWHKLFDDSNSIVSLSDNPLDYHSASSLDGKTLLGMRGHFYVGIDERVKSGDITRVDGNNERDNLMKLLARRGDALLLPTSTIEYFLTRDAQLSAQRERFFVSPSRHQSYTRYLMLPQGREDLLRLLQDARIEQWLANERSLKSMP